MDFKINIKKEDETHTGKLIRTSPQIKMTANSLIKVI